MATPLEQFIVKVRSLSSQGNFETLCEFVTKSTELLVKNAPLLDDVLATLDLQEHSLGVLAILCVKFTLPTAPEFEVLYAQVQEFITSCNGEQIRFAPEIFAELCHLFTQSLVEKQQPLRGISLLCKAIQKIQLFNSQLTSIHADLCQLCLLAKCFKPALPFLNTDITDINKEGEHFDAKHFLLFYYYGSMIYIALKKYDRAMYFLEVAITTPSMAVSHIMLEAYKKYILVSLILQGKVPNLPKYTSQVISQFIKVPNLPKYTSQVISRFIKVTFYTKVDPVDPNILSAFQFIPLSQPYHDLAFAYCTNNPDEVRTVINKNSEVYVRDKNMGLVKQCVSFLYKKNIQRLTKTFLTLSLSDMANRVQLSGPLEAEKYILNMIENGDIFASINQKDGMVVFLDNPEKYNSPSMFQQLEEEMKKCIQLDDKLRQMDQDISVNPKFIQKSSGIQDDDPSSTFGSGKVCV